MTFVGRYGNVPTRKLNQKDRTVKPSDGSNYTHHQAKMGNIDNIKPGPCPICGKHFVKALNYGNGFSYKHTSPITKETTYCGARR